MGLYEDINPYEGMTREELEKKFFDMKKKLINRQNGADLKKRTEAEMQMEIINTIQSALEKASGNFTDMNLLVKTYAYFQEEDLLNADLKSDLEKGLAGSLEELHRIREFISNRGEHELAYGWAKYIAVCGDTRIYHVCGFYAMDTNPQEAQEWFEKAIQVNHISMENRYNYGLLLRNTKQYAKAFEVLKAATEDGDKLSPYLLGSMYAEGEGVPVDLNEALKYFKIAQQRNCENAADAVQRVQNVLNSQQQKAQPTQKTQVQTGSNNTNTQQAQNGQPNLVFKGSKNPIPNLADINVDKLNIPLDKVEVPTEKIKGIWAKVKALPPKQLAILVIGLLVVISVLKGCLGAIGSKDSQNAYNEDDYYTDEYVAEDFQEDIEENVEEVILQTDTDATDISSFEYVLDGESARITNFIGTETEIIVPSVIEGKTVVSIDKGVFDGKAGITAITLKEGLAYVGYEAFRDCKSLKTISLPSTLLEIHDTAFMGCVSLSEVIIPEGVTYIGHNSFRGCSSLAKVEIPSTVTTIGNDAFRDDTKMIELILKEGVSDAYIGDNAFNGCKSLGTVVVPANYIGVNGGAFAGCDSLQSVTIYGKSAYVGYEAFRGCKSLKSLYLGSISEIHDAAFMDCVSLESALIPEGVTYIGHNAFRGCSNLTNVEIPSTVLTIGNDTFRDAGKLTSVTFAEGSGEAFIGDSSFENCVSLLRITIPGNYSRIGNYAFKGCKSLQDVAWENSGASYPNQVIGYEAFRDCISLTQLTLETSLYQIEDNAFYGCTVLGDVILPEGLVYIGGSAFRDCVSMTSVVLPSTIENIGDCAFRGNQLLSEVLMTRGTLDAGMGNACFEDCKSLTSVVIPGNYTFIGDYAFVHCTGLTSFEWEASDAVYANQIFGQRTFEDCPSLLVVRVTGNVGEAGYEMFNQSENVTIYAPADSAMAQYAAEIGKPFVAE